MSIIVLVACGTLSYFVYWLRYRATGRIRITPDLHLLWLLFWAALIFAVCQVVARKGVFAPTLP
jgi:hypothetical protein